MHKYKPRVHLVKCEGIYRLPWSSFQTFEFPDTMFFAVTAYQNEKVSVHKALSDCCYELFELFSLTVFIATTGGNPPKENLHCRNDIN